jgi:N-acetylglucosaminyldiphosphoundecaprenol N-acetyl-beta-D-mannosaminyltransferase
MEKFNSLSTQRTRRFVDIMKVPVDMLSLDEAVATIEDWSARKRQDPGLPGRRVITANPEYVMAAQRDMELMRAIRSAAMVTPDGVGLIIAGKLFGRPLPGRVTGVELSLALARRSAETGLRLFLLGAAEGVAEAAANRLREMYPGVRIVGSFAGQAGPEGDDETLHRVMAAQPDVILVAYGMGKQDRWAVRNLERSGAAVSIGVGGTFDYISGRVPLAPRLIRRAGMEWVFRLVIQPWRWRRDIAMLEFGSRALWLSASQFVTKGKLANSEDLAGSESLPELLQAEQVNLPEKVVAGFVLQQDHL